MSRLLRIADLTERWGCNEKYVLLKIHSGALKAINLSESRKPRWRIREADIERYERSRENDVVTRLPRPVRMNPITGNCGPNGRETAVITNVNSV